MSEELGLTNNQAQAEWPWFGVGLTLPQRIPSDISDPASCNCCGISWPRTEKGNSKIVFRCQASLLLNLTTYEHLGESSDNRRLWPPQTSASLGAPGHNLCYRDASRLSVPLAPASLARSAQPHSAHFANAPGGGWRALSQRDTTCWPS